MLRPVYTYLRFISNAFSSILSVIHSGTNLSIDLRVVVLPTPCEPVIIIFLCPLMFHLRTFIGNALPLSENSLSGAIEGVESNLRTKNAHESANGGRTTTIREPSFIVLTTEPFFLERLSGALNLYMFWQIRTSSLCEPSDIHDILMLRPWYMIQTDSNEYSALRISIRLMS